MPTPTTLHAGANAICRPLLELLKAAFGLAITWVYFDISQATADSMLADTLQHAHQCHAVLLQLVNLDLGDNQLMGTLPDTWSHLSLVSQLPHQAL